MEDADKRLSEKEFTKLSQLIWNSCGIKMPPQKKVLLEGRLSKRIRALGLKSLEEYCQFVFDPREMEVELDQLIDVVTTNKTEFFREPGSFRYLIDRFLPAFLNSRPIGERVLRIWSAGCSTGEEPYTLAMILSEFAAQQPDLAFDFRILATDVARSVLEKAKTAIYANDRLDSIPEDYHSKYLLRSKDPNRGQFRIGPRIRNKVVFDHLNLMQEFNIRDRIDVIYCRNVIIYFDFQTQLGLMDRFGRQLSSGGHLFLGHSETLNRMVDLPLQQVAPTIYRKIG